MPLRRAGLGNAAVRIPSCYLAGVLAFGQQIGYLFLQNGMNEVRSYLRKRFEDKSPKMQSRVRQRQEFAVHLRVAEKEDVQIDGAGLIERFVLATEQVLDTQQTSHHLRRADVLYMDFRDHIEEPLGRVNVNRFGLVDARQFVDDKARFH